MSHHSFLRIGDACFFYGRDGYSPSLAALFTEADRYCYSNHDIEYHETDSFEYGYQTTALYMRQRLQIRGFTTDRVRRELEEAIRNWQMSPDPDLPAPCTADEFLEEHQRILNDFFHHSDFHERYDLLRYLDQRSLLRLLLDLVPNQTDVILDLSELTGCCVQLNSDIPIAEESRKEEIKDVILNLSYSARIAP
ncbi:HEPN/Toprim-associated domain-containing protein [Streptosporangium sandarakinum]|uniref:HEPN/Toprim-associated domain-containing protein n=1 Tax=Streptosporangium sandarakinum TaxID=1260955 RepID=UPI00370F8407